MVRSLGLSQPSVGSHTAPRTPAGSNKPRNRWCASSVEISSRGSPNVCAHPAWRASSSRRAGVDARRSEPTSCQPGSWPVSAAKRRYSSTPFIIMRVSVRLLRSCPTRPAEWNVEPEVSWSRSTRTTSSHPSRVRW